MRTTNVLVVLALTSCTTPMPPDTGADTPTPDVPVTDVPSAMDVPVTMDVPATVDVPGSDTPDAPPPGPLAVIGGFGTAPIASGGALRVVGGFTAAPGCSGALCVHGSFNR